MRDTENSTKETFRHLAGKPSIGLVFGNFNQVPILSKAQHPEVDCKYYLDMQMNFAANDPVCRDIGLIGYWGSYYADDELHRWSFALKSQEVELTIDNAAASPFPSEHPPSSGGGFMIEYEVK